MCSRTTVPADPFRISTGSQSCWMTHSPWPGPGECCWLLREQDNLAADMTGGEASVRFADLGQRVGSGDRHL
jgi:hypothetical protein